MQLHVPSRILVSTFCEVIAPNILLPAVLLLQVLVTTEQPMLPHLADCQPPHKRQRHVDVHKLPAESSSQPPPPQQQQEAKALQQQHQQDALLQHQSALLRQQKGLLPLPQQQQPPSPYRQEQSPEARRTGTVHAAAGNGGTDATATGTGISSSRQSKERSLSDQLLLPSGGSSVLLGVQDPTSPTPYAPKYYISNDGTIAVVKQQQQQEQHKRLSLAIPVEVRYHDDLTVSVETGHKHACKGLFCPGVMAVVVLLIVTASRLAGTCISYCCALADRIPHLRQQQQQQVLLVFSHLSPT